MQAKTLRLIAISIFFVLPILLAAPVAAQSSPVENATETASDVVESGDEDGLEQRTNQTNLLYQFDGGGALRSVEYRDGSTWVKLDATDGDQRFAVSEGDLEGTGSFEYKTVSVDSGESRTVEIPVSKSSVVITTTQDGFYYEGSTGPPILLHQPTMRQIQMMGGVGIFGSIISIGLSIGRLRRKHENTYTELFSDETKKIEQDPYEGWKERVVKWFENRYESKISTVLGVGILLYIGGVGLGVIASPGELWLSLSDTNRLIIAGTIAAVAVSFFPVLHYVNKIYDPDRDFVADIDAEDVYRAAGDDDSGGLAIFSAPPERVNEMDVDGSLTRVPTPAKGGCYVVRNFDPEENTAESNPPTLSTDLECIAKADLIDENRNKLHQYEDIARKVLVAFPSMQKHSQFNVAAEMDSNVRELQSIGEDDDGLVGVMEDALEGTEFEDVYGGSDDSDPKGSSGENHQTEDDSDDSGEDNQ